MQITEQLQELENAIQKLSTNVNSSGRKITEARNKNDEAEQMHIQCSTAKSMIIKRFRGRKLTTVPSSTSSTLLQNFCYIFSTIISSSLLQYLYSLLPYC